MTLTNNGLSHIRVWFCIVRLSDNGNGVYVYGCMLISACVWDDRYCRCIIVLFDDRSLSNCLV